MGAHKLQERRKRQVMTRVNRERFAMRNAAACARVPPEDNSDFAWDSLPHTWIQDEKNNDLLKRQEREVSHYPVYEAATLRFRRHAEYSVQGGGRYNAARYGRARSYIAYATLDTPQDPYVRDNPGLKYLNQALVQFLINFYGDDLCIKQVSRC